MARQRGCKSLPSREDSLCDDMESEREEQEVWDG